MRSEICQPWQCHGWRENCSKHEFSPELKTLTHAAENRRALTHSWQLQVSRRMHSNKYPKGNSVPVCLKDDNGNIFIVRIIKCNFIILV